MNDIDMRAALIMTAHIEHKSVVATQAFIAREIQEAYCRGVADEKNRVIQFVDSYECFKSSYEEKVILG